MRRVVVLVVLLAMMLGITALKSDQVRAHDPMTLAAIGFVILAAFTVSEVGSLLKLPRVTGYILTGVVLGPSAANILSSDVVGEMKMFNTLALGLIATGAGLELDLGQLRKVWKTLFATIGMKVVVGAGLVIAAFIGMEATVGSLALPSQAQVIALALVLGALSIGTSPAIVLAVINESKAKGRLSDLMLGAAVLKDLVVVVVLAIAVAVARTLLAPDAALESSVLINVAEELGSSMAAGAVLGVLLILYVRYVHAEMLLFVAAMILVVSELGMALHLELLLVFITAGFVVRNFSRHEHDLANPLSLVSLPVFVVFFTNAGASVDLLTTWRILPLALALCAARAVGFYVSARVGGVVGQESEGIRRNAWLGYLPQAGVTLGLVGLASHQLPELSGPIASTGMAVVALNLLVGPVTLRRALGQTGDIPGLAPAQTERPTKRPSALPEAPPQQVELEAQDAVHGASRDINAIEHEDLRLLAKRTHDRLLEMAEEFVHNELEPWAAAFRERASQAMGSDPAREGGPLQAWLGTSPEQDVDAHGSSCRCLYETLHAVIPSLPGELTVPLEHRHRSIQKGDKFQLRTSKRLRTLGRTLTFRRSPQRHIPVRLAARVALEPSLSSASADVLSAWCAFEAVMLERVSAFASGTSSKESVDKALERAADDWLRGVRAALDAHLSAGTGSLARLLTHVGSASLPASAVRYSSVEPEVRESLRRLHDEPAAWVPKLEAARSAPLLAGYLSRIDEATQEAVEQHVLARTTSAVQGMMPLIVSAHERISTIHHSVDQTSDLPLQLTALIESCRSAYPHDAELQVERSGSRLRPSASVHYVAVALREVVFGLPEQLTVLRPDVALRKVQRAREVTTRTVGLRDLATQQMLRSFLPDLDDCVQSASSVLARANAKVREAIDVALDALEAAKEAGEGGTYEHDALLRAVHHADQRLGEIEEQIRSTTETLRESALRCVQTSFEAMHQSATGKAVVSLTPAHRPTVAARAWHRLTDSIGPARIRWARARARIKDTLGQLRRSELTRDIQLRYEKPVLDAADIWSYTERWRAPVGVPDTYARLFDGEPVREHRRFTANQDALATLLAAEQAWLDGGPSSGLVAGAHGSGRTSLLNLCELEMTAPRLARLRRSRTPREVGLVAALAAELGCRPRMLNLVATLRHTRTLVLIDDLEHWVTPDASGFRDLERFLNLVVRTRQDTFWLATIGSEALELLEEAVAMRQAFGHVVTLQPLKIDALVHAVEGRHHLSGCSVTYPRTWRSQIIGRIRRTSDRMVFFHKLLSDSEGNLARALGLWVRAATVDDDGRVSLNMPRGLSVGLPFFAQMNVREVAVLVQLLRFGPMTMGGIATGMGVSRDEAERHVGFLRMAGLIEPIESGEDELRIPQVLRAPVLVGLRDVGAWT